MATRLKTHYVEVGYQHRSHRTRRNKKELKPPIFKEQKDLKKLEIKKSYKKLRKQKVIRIKKPRITYPSFRCFNCDNVFKLKFNPKKEQLLSSLICPKCSEVAYYSHYVPDWFLLVYYTSPTYSFARNLIKSGKVDLKTVIENL